MSEHVEHMNNIYLLNIIRMMKVGPNSAFMHTKNTFDIVSISGKTWRPYKYFTENKIPNEIKMQSEEEKKM